MQTNRDRLLRGVATFPRLLQQAGYATALVGKWHLQDPPEGFDHWCILPGQGAYFNPMMIANGASRRVPGYASEVITDEAIAWLNRRDPGKPFCLLVHHKAPHADWEPGPRHQELYADQVVPEPPTFDDDYATRDAAIRSHRLFVGRPLWDLHYAKRFGPLPADLPAERIRNEVYQRFIKDYLRCVASVDESVGRLLTYLDAQGLARNTAVIYTSDQGFFLGDHGMYDKRFMYEESIRMPLLARLPGIATPGTQVEGMALNVDLAPTLLDLAHAAAPADLDGRSLLPLVRTEIHSRIAPAATQSRATAAPPTAPGSVVNPPDEWRRSMYYRYYEAEYGLQPHEGLRTERYKLIHYLYSDQAWELYDLKQDPRELKNLYADPAYQTQRTSLEAELDRLSAKSKAGARGPPRGPENAHLGACKLSALLGLHDLKGDRGQGRQRGRFGIGLSLRLAGCARPLPRGQHDQVSLQA